MCVIVLSGTQSEQYAVAADEHLEMPQPVSDAIKLPNDTQASPA
jgi:hypothetical protein